MHVLWRNLLRYVCCLQQDRAAVWLHDQVSFPCSTHTWSHSRNAEVLICFIDWPKWMQKCLGPWGRAPVQASGSEQDREVLYHLLLSLRHDQRQNDRASYSMKWHNLHDFYFQACSMLAAAICCIMN